ncbi:MAG: winged helix-turn-helix domain-containing protein [Acidobacteria bacterium]|nr:winged helix-turn-helix domain-containing protein [Acidobacteriota bacterium]
MDETKRILTREGEIVSLTPKAFDLLLILLEHQGKVIDKDFILKKYGMGIS